ncbi:hypothetical protein PTKIN_Ptkin10aG0104700 [Pterospermum kingtungense]
MASFHQSECLQRGPEIQTALELETISSTLGKSSSTVEDGVFLTWKDLWVMVASRKNRRSILQGLHGYARPGELLAVMGPSGSGKSTFLDALAGRLGSHTRQAGDILVNGQKQTMAYGTSAYVTQDDALIQTLTVREAVCYSAHLQLPDTMSRLEKKERAEMTIKEMGLQNAMNTRIGGWGGKGLSGGEKRRVRICIEILKRPKLLFLDEPTSGLDSAASYHVMSRIASLNQADGIKTTIIASIHQPSNEVFKLFHNLFLLSEGKTMYFGAISAANEFFASNGFPCPTLQNPSDHFLKTINKDFDEDIEQGFVDAIPTEEVINILVSSYKSSDICQHVEREILQIYKQDSKAVEKEKRHANFFMQIHVLTRRSFINMYRDPSYFWLRLAFYIGMALSLGTIYDNIGLSYGSIQERGGVLTFVTTIMTLMAIGGFPSFVEEMKVFERERLNGHYGVIAFLFSNTVSALPFLAVISLISGAVSYYIPGLHKGYDHFLFYFLTLFACMMLVESLMMVVACLVPNFLMGITIGVGIQGLMALVGGFFLSPADIPRPVLKYPLHHISFHKYAFQGLVKNEFQGLTFPNNVVGGQPILTGEDVLRNIWHVEMEVSKWVDLAILFAMAVFYRFLFLSIIKTKEKIKPIIAIFKSVYFMNNVALETSFSS